MSKLILVRHGESEFNAKGLWTGWLDPDLSAKGRTHAKEIGKKLQNIEIAEAHVSDLKRSKDTWEIIHEYVDSDKKLPTIADKNLKERSYGKFAGKNKWQVKKEVGEEVFMKIRRSWDYAPDSGESLKNVYERVVPYYEKNILPKLIKGEVVIAVTHGNTNRALIKHLENISNDDISSVEMPHELVIIYHFAKGEVVKKQTISIE